MRLVTGLPPTRRLLFVLKQTRFNPGWERRVVGRPVGEFTLQDLTTLQKALVWKSYVQHFRANPRKVLYMLKLAYDLASEGAPDAQVDLLTDQETEAAIPEPIRTWPHIIWSPPDLNAIPTDILAQLQAQNYDTIAFLYPDSIGLGWSRVESQVAELQIPHALVLNGRKRLFAWDAETRRLLERRRIIEGGCLLEIVLMPVLILVSIPLALYDILRYLWWELLGAEGSNR